MASDPGASSRPSNEGSGGAIFVFLVIIVAAVVLVAQSGLISSGGASSSGGGTSAGSSVGVKFVKEAKKHDDEAYVYGGGHPISSYRWGSGLDCSSLINVVIFKVTGVREDLTARDFRNSKHWKSVKIRDVKPGDIMYILKDNHPERSDDHVVFVMENPRSGNPVVFEAYSGRPGIPFKDQIRQSSNRSRGEYDGALRWRK